MCVRVCGGGEAEGQYVAGEAALSSKAQESGNKRCSELGVNEATRQRGRTAQVLACMVECSTAGRTRRDAHPI